MLVRASINAKHFFVIGIYNVLQYFEVDVLVESIFFADDFINIIFLKGKRK